MRVYEWMIMFCMLILAVCAIVFPILLLVQRKHHHKEWITLLKEQQEDRIVKEEVQE